MGKDSAIEWTHATFNPWIGCTKVSPGCKHCYAEHLMDKRLGRARWGPGQPRQLTSPQYWKQPLVWDREAREAGERRRVFCASLADVFDEEADKLLGHGCTTARGDLWLLIEATPHLDWLVLTKRPERILRGVPVEWHAGGFPPNVWFGTSVEDQAAADERIPHLLRVPARVRFLSMEPLLERVVLPRFAFGLGHAFQAASDDPAVCCCGKSKAYHARVDWVIVGGESGEGARPMHPEWAKSLRDQCQRSGTPFLFKQWGEWAPIGQMLEDDYRRLYRSNRIAEDSLDQDTFDDLYGRRCVVDELIIYDRGEHRSLRDPKAFWTDEDNVGPMHAFKVGKKAAGRVLDGRTWAEGPRG